MIEVMPKHHRIVTNGLFNRIASWFDRENCTLYPVEALVETDAIKWLKNNKDFELFKILRLIPKETRLDQAISILMNEWDKRMNDAEYDGELGRLMAEYNYLCQWVVDQAKNELAHYRDLRKANSKQLKGYRPTDIVRRYYMSLVRICKENAPTSTPEIDFTDLTPQDDWKDKLHLGGRFPSARWVLRELTGELTMPVMEVITPEWVDGYTGDVDQFAYTTIKSPEDQGEKSDDSFDADEIFEAEMEDWRDDIVEPVFMQMQGDHMPTNHLGELRQEFHSLTEAFRDEIDLQIRLARIDAVGNIKAILEQELMTSFSLDLIYKVVDNLLDFPKLTWGEIEQLSKKIWFSLSDDQKNMVKACRHGMFEATQLNVRASNIAGTIIDHLQGLAHEEAAADIAVLFMSLQHGLGFFEPDADRIRLEGQWPTLFDYIEEFGDDIAESIASRDVSRWTEITREELELFSSKTIDEIAAISGDDSSPDNSHHVSWIKGYLVAFSNGARSKEAAKAAAWVNFRITTSPEGNEAFKKAMSEGASYKDAMAKFWRVVHRDTVQSADQRGLYLSSGRLVNYAIAKIKILKDEIEWKEGQKEKLKGFLVANNYGPQLAAIL